MIKILLILTLFLSEQNQSFNAKVIGVKDGDTIVVLTQDNTQVTIRFEGIDCPEAKQAFGNRAKQATVDLCFQKYVHIIQTGSDRYKRILAKVFVDEIYINKELIRIGMAWHFKEYNADEELAKMEIDARNRKVGLWSQPNPEAPWNFRVKGK